MSFKSIALNYLNTEAAGKLSTTYAKDTPKRISDKTTNLNTITKAVSELDDKASYDDVIKALKSYKSSHSAKSSFIGYDDKPGVLGALFTLLNDEKAKQDKAENDKKIAASQAGAQKAEKTPVVDEKAKKATNHSVSDNAHTATAIKTVTNTAPSQANTPSTDTSKTTDATNVTAKTTTETSSLNTAPASNPVAPASSEPAPVVTKEDQGDKKAQLEHKSAESVPSAEEDYAKKLHDLDIKHVKLKPTVDTLLTNLSKLKDKDAKDRAHIEKVTYQMLTNKITVAEYREHASKVQGHASPTLRAIGYIMETLAVIALSLGIGLGSAAAGATIAAGLAVVGAYAFFKSRPQGSAKDMENVAQAQVASISVR